VDVVSPTPERDVVDNGWSTDGIRFQMVKLQESAFRATAMLPDEGALAAIALPDLPPHSGRNMP